MVMRRDVVPGTPEPGRQRWSTVENLCCPVCRRGVRAKPPGYWKVADGPLPQWSHRDGRALCEINTDDGPRRTEPMERVGNRRRAESAPVRRRTTDLQRPR